MKLVSLFILFFGAAVSISAQIKKPQPTPVKVPFAQSLQMIVVTTKDWNATSGTARLFERKSVRDKWKQSGEDFGIVVGRTGLAWSQDTAPETVTEFKKEGDGKAPAGAFPLTFVFGAATKPEQLTFPYTRLESQTECVDDVKSSHYNKVVGRLKVGNFDWKSSEKMLAVGPQYDLGVFVAHNTYPVVKGNGSCIFLHIWKDASTPTAGCTAMEQSNLERVVSWIDASKHPYLIQLPEPEYKRYKKAWNLPK
ncbi:MAG TPA: L,D-transpeptidase family protein [Pyrinomonadaceae bacterium]|nr:L,D-transpeptidase family protein [Pyrinomonadaceae bacterium]